MNAGKAVYGILSTNTEVTDIVSTRIYPEIAEQEAPVPFIVYQVQNVAPEDTHDGPSTLDEIRFEFLCYDATYNGAAELGDKVRGALDRVQGTYNTVNVQSVQFNDVDTEIIDEPRRYAQVLTFTFRIARDNFQIAQGTPVTGAKLGDLYDVNTTGVTNGQVIAYDAATAVWLPATDAGGAESLNDLTDVIISQPAQGEFFRYSGGEWVNDTANKSDVGLANVDNISDANKPISTDTQTALDLKADITSVPTELDDLNDVQIIGTPTLGQALVYGAGKWLPGAAGATELGDLDDVSTAGAAFGSLLTYNGSSWIIGAAQLPTDDIYFHERYATESEALRTGATATTELYFTCTAQGNGLAESASSDTPTAGQIIKRKIYYSEAGFADPDTGTWIEFTPAPADDAAFATVKAALLENLKARTGGTVPISLKQTWEEVAGATDLLDTYTGAAVGYSLRRLKSTATNAIRVRRSSDNTEQNIGFTAGELDTSSLLAFVGTGGTDNGYIRTFFDQSGNSNDATQTATGSQPQIVSSGAVIVDANGKPELEFDGSDDYMSLTSDVLQSDANLSIFSIAKHTESTVEGGLYDLAGPLAIVSFSFNRTASNSYGTANFRSGVVIGTDGDSYNQAQSLFTQIGTASTNDVYRDGVQSTQAYSARGSFKNEIGRASVSYYLSGTAQEFVIYPAAKSSTDQTGIETNIATFYGITL